MADSNNICYEVVNISWLKSLVGSAVQDSNGNVVSVSEKSGTTYCPTYGELTNGTFIPYRSTSSDGPASDSDGITVNRTCYATGEDYANNQLVNKHDVAVCNTRLKSFTVDIANSSTDISGCNGDSRNLSYTRIFTRNTWDISTCDTTRHTSTDVNDVRNNLITWTTNIGNIVDSTSAGSGKAISVSKNTPPSTGGSSSRTITVTGSSTFRGSTSTPIASVMQGGVGGSYKHWYDEEVDLGNKRISCSGEASFGCKGGSYSAVASHDYKVRSYYVWKDTCGTEYDSWQYYEDGSTGTKTDDTYSGSFPDITVEGGHNSDSWSKSGYEGSCSWTQSCEAPSITWGTGTCVTTASCDGELVEISATVPGVITYGDGSTASTSIEQTATVNVPICKIASGCTTSGTVNVTYGAISYTITQNNCVIVCPNDNEVYRLYDFEIGYLGEDGVELGCTLNNSNFTSYTFSYAGDTGMTNVGYNGSYDNDYPIFAADFEPNYSQNERIFTIFLIGTTNDGQNCHYYINVKQKGVTSCSCDSLTVNGTLEPCSCNSMTPSGALEPEGLSFFAKITNNTNSPINVTAIGFDINESGEEEEFHNQQVIAANSTADYNNGNPICLITCDNTYTIANISNFYIEIDDATYTATCDKTIIRDGDTITLTYNG